MKGLLGTLFLALFVCTMFMQAAPLFPQCPAIGSNTGCQFLLTINPNLTVSIAQDPNAPNNGPYDGSEDTLVGVFNNSTSTITTLPLSSSTDIFGFDGDGPCDSSIGPPTGTGCGAVPNDYAGPGITFSGINAAQTAGVVNFTGGLAPGTSRWFGLEDTLQISQIVPGTPGGGGAPAAGVPEPASLLLIGTGFSALALIARRRQPHRN